VSERRGVTRRRFLAGAGGLTVAGVVAGCAAGGKTASSARTTAHTVPNVSPGSQPAGLPGRQYAWDAVLDRDQYGNAVAPRFDQLLMFDVKGKPTAAYRDLLEASLRKLERTYKWGPEGLLFVAGWGHGYFTDVLKTTAPIPLAKRLSDFEKPKIQDYDLCLHLACDDEQRLVAVSSRLLTELQPILEHRETRTGFVGAGLPYRHQHVNGIPAGNPVPKDSPLFMGFKSSLKKNQASEDSVAIAEGPFAEGTTMHVSYMTLTLDDWYDSHTQAQRVALMYSPQTTVEASKHFTTDAESNPGQIHQAINKYSVIGHAQSSATARRNGKPIILRRDFDTTDHGIAGLHFVALQQTIADFVKTRTAMNQAGAPLQNPAIGATVNNGINNFIFVMRRANFIVPSRRDRSFPLLSQ
jgi:Dyp-type peroxidase family